MKKLLLRTFVVLVVLVVIGYLARNFIARRSVEIGVTRLTGFPLEIGAMDVGLFSSQLDIRDLKLMNSADFPEKLFVDLPLFHVSYKLGSLLTGAPHVKELVVNVQEVVIVKNAAGRTNANAIQDKLAPAGSGAEGGPEKPAAAPAKKTAYRVDLLRVHIGTVVMKDFSKAQPSERKLTLNRDVIFENITESTSISALVMNVVFGQLGDVAGGLIKGFGGLGKDATQSLQKTGKGLFDSLKKAIPQQ